jgi:peptidoglycan/LPS O-acetylase OafA/YrhL
MQKLPPIKYFKNLDGLRFFAALAVIFGHSQYVIHQYQGYYAYSPWANKLASFGVDFFFVLSGFLISYLLMQEIEKTGTISIRGFYRRRAVRIFPLYFLVGMLGIVTGGFWIKYLGYLNLFDGQYRDYLYNWPDFFRNFFFLGSFSINFQTFIGLQNPVSSFSVGHLWSIAVEEQFYLVWAPMVYLLRRNLPVLILFFAALGLLFNLLPKSIFQQYYQFQYYFTVSRFWHFGLGAAFAWWIQYVSIDLLQEQLSSANQKNESKLRPNINRILPVAVILGQICCLYPVVHYLFGSQYRETIYVINAVIALVIIAVAIAKYSVFTVLMLENPALKYLGKISYGIYMFHIFAIYITYAFLKNIGIAEKSNLFYFLVPVVATVLSVALASFSYTFFEQRFQKHKKR